MDLWIVFFVPTVILVGLVLPLWLLFHYVTKWREQKRQAQASREDMEALWRIADKLERRLNSLEAVIDDTPSQRSQRL
ncbi:phage shock protein B [Rhodospirillaceae bacterium KN72]|uniref:Phage shock protein B n=1 Tax=Pacificispira spongiicola TaxID=2729598 RepID=A0A7Y0DZ72_9PROT|nr:envelope stress response membrane protein PspB [Pacificispira spongiicola]NMM44280.1 phage shock protein B [Pacificispira spongiicola]